MDRQTYYQHYRNHRINRREAKLAEYADSPWWAEQHLTYLPSDIRLPPRTEMGYLIAMQRERRRAVEARVRIRKSPNPMGERVDTILHHIGRKYDTTQINRYGSCRPIIIELVRAGQSSDQIADYFQLPLKEG